MRFQSPFEFGTSYQLTVSDITYNSLRVTPSRLTTYIYYYFLQPLDTELFFPFIKTHTDQILTVGNYMYHAASMGLLSIPFYFFLFLFRHPCIDYRNIDKKATYLGLLLGSLLLAFLNFSLGGVFIRYLCDITVPLALLSFMLMAEYDSTCTTFGFSRRTIITICIVSTFIGTMLIFSNEKCLLLNYAPEYYLRIMDLFRL